MNPKVTFFQLLACISHLPGYRAFRASLKDPEAQQRAKLQELIRAGSETSYGRALGLEKNLSYEDFATRIPLSTYADLDPWIEKQRKAPAEKIVADHCRRFEPTSGSTDRRKWIPYPAALMRKFDAAASAWIFDMSLRHPRILGGSHYWSLSWIPTELRGQLETVDELEVFSAWKKFVMNQIMAVPSEVSRLPTMEESLVATLTHLAGRRDLSLVSVWSPTFFLQALHTLADKKAAVAEKLGPVPVASLLRSWDGKLSPDFLSLLWPRLRLISCWDTSASAPWAAELRALFPDAAVEGKGLWATEGVVTFPFQGMYPLALTSHFFEFRDLNTEKILPAWLLREGLEVQPIFTTGAGFYRYQLPDRLKVTGFLEKCPSLKFLGRLRGTDLVGEKMDAAIAAEALSQLNLLAMGQCLSLLGRGEVGQKPRYFLLACADAANSAALAVAAEKELLKSHHYKVARELGQLAPVEAKVFATLLEAQTFYETAVSKNSRIAGVGKIDPLSLWQSEQ